MVESLCESCAHYLGYCDQCEILGPVEGFVVRCKYYLPERDYLLEKRRKRKKEERKEKDKNEIEIDTGVRIYKSCPYAERRKVLLYPKVYGAIRYLLSEFRFREWLIYVYGEERGNEIHVKDFYVPEQEVTASSVKVIEDDYPKENLLGSIHSHNSMASFRSCVDVDHHNYPLQIVVNNDLEFTCAYKFKAPCGHFLECECDVELYIPMDVRIDKNKIKSGKVVRPI